ncbi:MAG TPA: hypothetical protein VGM29_00600 [Polyangiaceae bacterium]
MPRPIQTDAALGRVVVYRNGVAYFERRALIDGDHFTLEVPAERLDDFLKSLSVVDARSGKAVPISFPTMDHASGTTTVVIELPRKDRYDLRISYVTESPAWKPTYRLKLDDKGHAALESWAVVDNVSGEDWKRVAVGVGSTSALSFKYDLQSVRYVERETLSDETELGVAPPSGGSPYAVASKEVKVLGNFGAAAIDALKDDERRAQPVAELEMDEAAPAAPSTGGGLSAHFVKTAQKRAPSVKMPAPTAALSSGLVELANRLRSNKEHVRILGYAQAADKDSKGGSLARANAIRDELLKNGVDAAQVEAIGTGRVSNDGVRVVAAEHASADKPAQAATPHESSSDAPLGSAYFLAPSPLTIEKGHSAMVSMLSADALAQQVYFYDPISNRGSKRFAYRAVLLTNPTQHTLDAGPVTVYEGGQFLGEGLSEPIPGNSRAFVPFALDRKLLVDSDLGTREQVDRLLTIERGVVQSEARSIRTTKLSFTNRDSKVATVYVRHPISEGFKLEAPKTKVEKLGGAYLFAVEVPAGESAQLSIEESTPIQKSIDIRTDAGVAEIALYLRAASGVDPELSQKLDKIVQTHREMAELGERIETIQAQSAVYRERVDEINVQLVSLRKVVQASELSRHLAQKMQEISNKLQHATIDLTDLQGQLLTERVALEDQLSDLSLDKRKVALADHAAR